jgi:biopolymer transport protein ExbB
MVACTWRSSRCASAVVAIALVACGGSKPRHTAKRSPRPGWGARVELAIALPNAVPLEAFPVPIRLAPDHIDYARIARDGHDLRLTDASGVDVPYEIETFAPGKTSWLWVRLPRAEPNLPTKLWLYFDNPRAPYLDPSESREVWIGRFAGVYHLTEDVADSSSNQNTTSPRGMTPSDGVIGPARFFSGKPADAITGALPAMQEVTACAWVRTESTTGTAVIVDAGGVELAREGTGVRCGGAAAANVFVHDRWRYVCCVARGGTATVFVDGVPSTRTGRLRTGRTTKLAIGAAPWAGAIDEVRVSNVARDADWLGSERASVGDVVKFGAIQNL